MKVVFITDQIYLHGGLERVLINRMNILCKLNTIDVFLITSKQNGNKACYKMNSSITHFDIDINYNNSKSYFSFENLIKSPKHFLKLRDVLKKINPSCIVLSNFGFDFYFLPFTLKGIKKIKEFHSSRYYYSKEIITASFFKKTINKINFYIEKRYDKLVLLNSDEKKYYHSQNTVVIPNFISYSQKNKLEKQSKKNIIIAAGRIAPVKQFHHLIEAWSIISKDFPDWNVEIYGEGDKQLLNELIELIKKKTVSNIQFMGATNKLNKKMEEASIYALTSATECFPMVLLEALSCGLPIISYDCPHGPINIITNNKDGILVAHNNITAFAKELSKLIYDTPLRDEMRENSLENVTRFNEKNIIPKWLQLFKNK